MRNSCARAWQTFIAISADSNGRCSNHYEKTEIISGAWLAFPFDQFLTIPGNDNCCLRNSGRAPDRVKTACCGDFLPSHNSSNDNDNVGAVQRGSAERQSVSLISERRRHGSAGRSVRENAHLPPGSRWRLSDATVYDALIGVPPLILRYSHFFPVDVTNARVHE
jgi:hypothetical protein